jgi:hypothetical protein
LRITAIPVYNAGHVGLKDVKVAPERNGFYASRVAATLGSSLESAFRYSLADDAKRALEDPGAQRDYPRQLQRFDVKGIRVTGDALVLDIDFAVVVR